LFRVLLEKELRQLRGWIALVLTVELGLLALELLLVPTDEIVWALNAPIFSAFAASSRAILLFFWALLFGNVAFAREHDEGTFELLFNLPVPRARLFAAKALAGAGSLSLVVLLGEFCRVLAQLPNSSSFGGHTFRLDWALISAGCSVGLAWIAIGYGIFLSLFRRMSVLLCLFAVTLLKLLEKVRPASRRLDPLELLHLEFYNSRALVPWSAYAGHLLVAAAAAAVGGVIWLGRTERASARLTKLLTSAVSKWLFALCILAVLIASTVYLAQSDDHDGRFGSLVEVGAPEARLETTHYTFRYPKPLRARLEQLTKSADTIYERVQRRLTPPKSDERIDVNLLKPSATHAGSATWNAIRMDLSEAYDDENLRHTLAHESSHVLALRASDRRLDSQANTLRFFDEGLAEAIAFEIAPAPNAEEARWLEAALTRSRSRVDFSALIDFDAFTHKYGERALYPLGFTWARALLTSCGEDAPARFLAALARPDTPLHLSGEPLVQHVLQSVHCDLGQVISEWGRELDRSAARFAPEIASVPFLLGGARRDEDEDIVLRAELRGPKPNDAGFRVNVRARADAPLEDQLSVQGELEKDGSLRFDISEDYVQNGVLDYQFEVAWLYRGAPVQYDDEWRQTRVPK
jgi:hypothetical protein